MAESDVCCVLQCPLSEPSRSMRSVCCFFAFPHPSDPRYPVWIERTLRPKDWTPSAASRICSRHFRSSDIVILPSAEYCEEPEKHLKNDALPCLFEGIPRTVQPPAECCPPSHSPDIAVSSVLKVHRPIESVPRPDSPEIAVPSTKKRSTDSCLSTLQPPPTKAARVDKEMIERCTESPKATPSTDEECAAAFASPAQMLHCPSPDILFRPLSSDKPVATEPLPLPLQSDAAADPSPNSPKQPESRGEVGLLVDLPDRSRAQPMSAAEDAETLEMCCVPGCSITSRNATQTGDTLFPFLLPEHKLYDAWVKRIRCTTSWQPQPPSFICSRHFLRSDIKTCRISTNARKAPFPNALRDDAVPCRSACIAAFHFSGIRDGETENAQSVAEVQSCRACGAKRNGWTKPSEMLLFYPFPSARHLNSLWTGFLPDQGRRELTTEPAVVCQNHFAPDDFETSGALKATAVPSRMLIFQAKDRYKLVRKEADSKAPKEGTVCCVPGCRIPAEELGSGRITYMHFPLDPARRDEWIRCVRCAVSWAPRRGFDMVCSRHFTAQDFSQSVNQITGITVSRLKQSAVPSQLECVEQFRTPINPKIPLTHPKIPHNGVPCCCICRWWRSPEPAKRSERLTFFSFPKLVAQRQLWVTACRELSPEFVFTVGSLVCENHFKPDDWTWGKSKLLLKPAAVPSIRTPNGWDSLVLENGIFEQHHALTNGDLAAADTGLPVAVGNKRTNNLETVGDLRLQSHENDHTPMETDAPSAYKDHNASLQSSLPAASRNGLPEDVDEENPFDHSLVISPLPDVQVPPTTRIQDLNQTPTIITTSAPSDTFIYCKPCCKLMQTPCWIHSDSIPDEPVIPMAIGSLPKILYMDVCDESPTGKTVYAREAIVRHTVFGPLIAPTVFSDVEKARYVDVSDVGEDAKRKQYKLDSDYLCNWMKHVRLADSVEASNLLVFPRGCEIVFVTSKSVSPHEELRVYYSRQYLDLLNPATAIQNFDADGEIPADGAERMSENIKEEPCPDLDEEILDYLSLQSDLVIFTASSDPDDGNNSTIDGDICEELFRIYSISDGEIVYDAPVPNNTGTSQLSPKVKPRKNAPARKKVYYRRPRSAVALLYSCNECGLRFTNKSVLEVHRLGYQPAAAADKQDSEHYCPECGAAFEHLGDQIQHVDLHGELTRRCPVCSLRCPVPDLKHHMRRCHPQLYAAEEKKSVVEAARSVRQAFVDGVTCSQCGLQFASTLLCSVHKRKHDSADRGEAVMDASDSCPNVCNLRICPPCGEIFDEFEQLVEHVEEHGKLTEKCPVCQQWFASLEEHFNRDHPDVSLKDCEDQPRRNEPVASESPVQCRLCEKSFPTPGHLKIHTIQVHNPEALTCAQCGRRFRLAALCRLHQLQHDDNNPAEWLRNSRTCVECGETFADLQKLLVHVDVHGVPTQKCRLCGKNVAVPELRTHMRHDHQHSTSQPETPLAGALVKVCRMTLPRHAFTAATSSLGQGKKPFQCTLCDKSFSLQSALRAHEMLHQPATPVSGNLTCEKCGLRFRSHMLSQLHRLKHKLRPSGRIGDKELTCPKCGDIFDKWQDLMDHVEDHGRPMEQCRVCGQWFDNVDAHLRRGQCGPSSQLERSSSANTGGSGLRESSSINTASRHSCQDCGKEFEQQSSLSDHQKKHLNLTFIKSFTCDECGMRFTAEALRHLHVLQHGNIAIQHPRERRCPHCNKSFKNLRELVVHVDEHGRTTDKCSHCNRWFGHLPGHIGRSHPAALSNSVDERHQSGQNSNTSAKCVCGVCGDIFLTKELLVVHAKEHNSGKEICTNLRYTMENNVAVYRESSPEILEPPSRQTSGV